jgi:DNA-directed RNA polymerase specialized sigma24 family protein
MEELMKDIMKKHKERRNAWHREMHAYFYPEAKEDATSVGWTQIAQTMARRQASHTGGWLNQDDLVQEALVRILEAEGGTLEKIWAARQGIRNPLRKQGREPSADMDIEVAAGLNPGGELAPPPPEDDDSQSRLERRIRDAYDDPDTADAAWSAQSGTGWGVVEEEARLNQETLEEALEGRQVEPVYLQDEYEVDRGKVDLTVNDLPDVAVEWLAAPDRKWTDVERGAARALEIALETHELNPAEQGTFANALARAVVDAMPYSTSDRDKAIRYGCVRIGVADGMGDLLLDEDVWAHVYPDGYSDVAPLYDRPATEEEMEAFVEKYVHVSKPPEDAAYENGVYKGWRYWNTEVARKAHARVALHGGSYRGDANAAAGQAFWGQGWNTISEYLRRHHKALDEAGLKEIVITNDDLDELPEGKREYARALRYKVVPKDTTPVMRLHRDGVTDTDGRRHHFSSGLPSPTLAVPEEHAEGLVAGLKKTNAPNFVGIIAV